MSETSATHHKIKAEWTKASKNELYDNSIDNSSSESDKLEIIEDEILSEPPPKIEILEQIVIYPNQKSVKCHFCDKNFEKSYLEEHQKIHSSTFYHCTDESCDKKFRRKSSLRKHSYQHKGRFKYECTECKVTFIDLTKYELHKNTKHETKDSPRYHCPDPNCRKSFASPDYLKRHQVTHNDEYKYKCTVCDSKFKWMTSLQLHQTIHTQNKALVECSKCRKRFFNQRTLERHQRIHKNVKFKCMLCDKVASNRKDNIRRHIRHLHTDVEKSEISSKIAMIEDLQSDKFAEDDASSSASDPSMLIIDIPEDPIEDLHKPPSPPPTINNRVNVIQSIGNPNKQKNTQPDDEIIQDTAPLPALQLPQKSLETEIKLPPKKKAIANSQPSTSVNSMTPAAKPKYDPIQHYRKILLGFTKDDDHTTTLEDSIEDEESEQEPQVFPVHWRKRTSQNFLFRR